jgi:hypothetical protein
MVVIGDGFVPVTEEAKEEAEEEDDDDDGNDEELEAVGFVDVAVAVFVSSSSSGC